MGEIKRRKFLKQAGQTTGLVIAAASIKSLLVSCAGNAPTTGGAGTETTAANSALNESLVIPGQLQWGAESTSGAPFVFRDPVDPAKIVGFEVEIAAALAKVMGLTSTQVETAYPQLGAALASKKFDFIMNGWEITPDRETTQAFSTPYYHYGQQIVVRADDPRFKDVTAASDFTLKDLAGMKIGTGAGYKAEEILRAATPKVDTRAYDGNLPFDDLTQKKIDAIMLDSPIVIYYVLGAGPGSRPNPALKPAGKPIFLADYVLGFSKNNPKTAALKVEVDKAIETLKKDGTLKKIYQDWKMWNDQQAEIGIT
jgi:polar amino acid transport system substrate-binding protein